MAITAIYGPFGEQIKNALLLGTQGGDLLVSETGVPFSVSDPSVIAAEDGGSVLDEQGEEINEEQDVNFPTLPGETIRDCPAEIFPFRNQVRTEIIYSETLRQRHGNTPTVMVYYYDQEEGGLMASAMASRMSMIGSPPTKIIVDHGGPNTGIIKLF